MIRFFKTNYLALLICILFVVFNSYKISRVGELWDEIGVALYGEIYIGAIKNLDFSKSTWKINHEHPPLGKYIYGVARFITKKVPLLLKLDPLYHPDKSYSFARFISVVLSALTIFAVYLLGKTLKDKKTGLAAALFLVLNPVFLAYSNTVSLEVPLLFFSSVFVLAFYKALMSDSKKWFLVSVLFLGFALSSRYNGAFLGIFYLVTLGTFYKRKLFTKKNTIKIFYPVLSLLFLFIIWPYLWHSPIKNFWLSVDRGFEIQTEEYLLGSLGIYGLKNYFYYFLYFLVSTPIPLLLLFITYIFFIKKQGFQKIFLSLFFLTPFIASIFPLKQDGIRYAQFMVIPLALICSLSFFKIYELLETAALKKGFSFLVFSFLLFSVVRFYPYYLDYYNILTGGVRNVYAKRLFELGWWGEGSYQASKAIVNCCFEKESKIYFNFVPAHVFSDFGHNITRVYSFDKDPEIFVDNIGGERYGDYSRETIETYLKDNDFVLISREYLPQKVSLYKVFVKRSLLEKVN